jgi:hypothetical protein
MRFATAIAFTCEWRLRPDEIGFATVPGLRKSHDFETWMRVWRKRSPHKGDGMTGPLKKWLKGLPARRYERRCGKIGDQPIKTECKILIALNARHAVIPIRHPLGGNRRKRSEDHRH